VNRSTKRTSNAIIASRDMRSSVGYANMSIINLKMKMLLDSCALALYATPVYIVNIQYNLNLIGFIKAEFIDE
jgi:hypothetical protein